MDREITQGFLWVRREGDRILIDSRHLEDDEPLTPTLVFLLTEEGGLTVDPEWEQKIEARNAHIRRWRDLVAQLNLGSLLSRHLRNALPPYFVDDSHDMVNYLWAISSGEIKVEGLGKRGRELIYEALVLVIPNLE